jgi:predicted NAD-dependent protein-ADP-ribosyltransferase YbiA (DUF1768 family)
MEKNAGQYYVIPAFRQFKTDVLGSSSDQDQDQEEDMKEPVTTDIYENDETTFVFHSKSDRHKKPGHGVGEKIPKLREREFIELYSATNSATTNSQTKDYKPWRQQLDDTWDQAPFTVDNQRWTSVSHYLLAVTFKDSDPEIYKSFSVDSGTNISKDWNLAKESIEKKKKEKDTKEMTEGKYYAKYKNIRKLSPESLLDYRKDAIRAKFSQNADLSTMLSKTKRAKLMHYVSQKPAITDIQLMQLRKEMEK